MRKFQMLFTLSSNYKFDNCHLPYGTYIYLSLVSKNMCDMYYSNLRYPFMLVRGKTIFTPPLIKRTLFLLFTGSPLLVSFIHIPNFGIQAYGMLFKTLMLRTWLKFSFKTAKFITSYRMLWSLRLCAYHLPRLFFRFLYKIWTRIINKQAAYAYGWTSANLLMRKVISIQIKLKEAALPAYSNDSAFMTIHATSLLASTPLNHNEVTNMQQSYFILSTFQQPFYLTIICCWR